MLLKLCENCDPKHLDELVTGDETWLYYSEPLTKAMNKAWLPKGGVVPLIAKRNRSEKVLYAIVFDSQGIVLQKPRKAGKSITGETVSVWNLTNITHTQTHTHTHTHTKKKLDQPQARSESNCFMIMYLYTSKSLHKSISPRKTLKLCHTLLTPRILHHVISGCCCCCFFQV